MSNIDAMKYKSRFLRKPKGIQGDLVAGTKVCLFSGDGYSKTCIADDQKRQYWSGSFVIFARGPDGRLFSAVELGDAHK